MYHSAERISMEEKSKVKQHITLHVYDTSMSVYCQPDQEEYYRKAAVKITQTVNQYAQVFKGKKSDKEILYMTLIDIALQLELEKQRNDTEPFADILEKLKGEIEQELNH